MSKGKSITQGYIAIAADGTEVRLREKGDKFFLTLKSDGGLVRGEAEAEITVEQYITLVPATQDRNLKKTRYEHDTLGGVCEVDVFEGRHDGLKLVEVEFPSISSSQAFVAPAWFGKEVTEDKRYKNKNLAESGVPV